MIQTSILEAKPSKKGFLGSHRNCGPAGAKVVLDPELGYVSLIDGGWFEEQSRLVSGKGQERPLVKLKPLLQ